QVAVEYDEIERGAARKLQTVAAVALTVDCPAQLLEAVGDVVARALIVLNDEQAPGHECSPLLRGGSGCARMFPHGRFRGKGGGRYGQSGEARPILIGEGQAGAKRWRECIGRM